MTAPKQQVLSAGDLQELSRLECAATPSPWTWTCTKQQTRAEVLAFFTEHYDRGKEGPLHGCGVPAPGSTIEEECLATAVTGNGPTSEANAIFLVALRNACRRLIDSHEALRMQLAEANERLFVFSEQIREMWGAIEAARAERDELKKKNTLLGNLYQKACGVVLDVVQRDHLGAPGGNIFSILVQAYDELKKQLAEAHAERERLASNIHAQTIALRKATGLVTAVYDKNPNAFTLHVMVKRAAGQIDALRARIEVLEGALKKAQLFLFPTEHHHKFFPALAAVITDALNQSPPLSAERAEHLAKSEGRDTAGENPAGGVQTDGPATGEASAPEKRRAQACAGSSPAPSANDEAGGEE